MINYVINEKDIYEQDIPLLTLNGEIINPSLGSVKIIGDVFYADITDEKLARQIISYKFVDIPIECREMKLSIRLESLSNYIKDISDHSITITYHKEIANGSCGIDLNFHYNPKNWKHIWSISEYLEKVGEMVWQEYEIDNRWSFFDHSMFGDNKFGIHYKINDRDIRIINVLSILDTTLTKIFSNILMQLSKDVRDNAVVTFFDFPQEVKASCEQYLLYFIQFLRDIGVEATAELKEEAGRVLFAVTPQDEKQALDNIEQALEIYLRLPSSREFHVVSTLNTNIESQRLSANILHLQSQLVLASAIAQQKDTLIQQQQEFIQQQLLSGQVLIQSINRSANEKGSGTNKEPLIGDIVKVRNLEWEFLDVDLPTLLRRLKKLFGRNK